MTKTMIQRVRMRLLGLALLVVGSLVIVYSVAFDSASSGFWSLYVGMLLVTTGLGFLGLNAGTML
jgi:hypothetical protein